MRYQELRIRDHDCCRGCINTVATLCLELVNKRLIIVDRSCAISPCTCSSGSLQFREQGIRYTVVLDRMPIEKIIHFIFYAVWRDYNRKCDRGSSGQFKVVYGTDH